MANTSSNGIPQLGLGTFGRTDGDGLQALLKAIEIGYRHIDTAQSYGTEENVGLAAKQSGLPREDVFITTKVADTNLDKGAFLPSVEKSLETLDVDYVDLLLIHWPSSKDTVPFDDYMEALGEAKAKGWARRIGVSNFPIADLKRSDAVLGAGALNTNQVELHPYLQSPKLRDYARSAGLQLTAYMPLAKGRVSTDSVLMGIAERHAVTASAVALAFLMQEGHIVIPASSNEQRLRDNFAATETVLTDEDMSAIRALDRNKRLIDPDKAPEWDD